ncbi:NAD-dependent protein deacylase SRT2 [Galdieria sulphuraria]|nr:NAD-dependent protein deacylase SRT2 [Galdieria sulphuraria]
MIIWCFVGHCLQQTLCRRKLIAKYHETWRNLLTFLRKSYSTGCHSTKEGDILESVYPSGLKSPDKYDRLAVLQFLEKSFKRRASHGKVCVISGAGISTESGIPDYRSPGRPPHKPITHDQFVSSAAYRRRYWARSYVGYERLSKAKPGKTHVSLAVLDQLGLLSGNISQNVDGLLSAECGLKIGRDVIQLQMRELNMEWNPESEEQQERSIFERPDGDYAVTEELVNTFYPPFCFRCGRNSILKPDVVFFGGNVPKENALRARQFIEQSDAILVLGSSLSTFSAYGLVQRASSELSLPICIINYGPTRADHLATLKLDVDTGHLMFQVCQHYAPEHIFRNYFDQKFQHIL